MTRLNRRHSPVIAALLAAWGLTAGGGKEYPWKDGNKFEIHRVNGVERTCEAGSRITLEVFGRSVSTNVEPEPKSGFHVQASIDHEEDTKSRAGANGEWNEELNGWVVELVAPEKSRNHYRLQVFLYCADDTSECARTYGRAAQAVETFHFDVP